MATGGVVGGGRGVWACSCLGSFREIVDGSALVPFPWACWLEGVYRLDGDDGDLAALRFFRCSEEVQRNRRKR